MKRLIAIILLALIVLPLFAVDNSSNTYELMTQKEISVDPFMYGQHKTVKITNPFSHSMLVFFWFMAIGGGATVLLLTATALVKAIQNQEEDPNGVQKVVIRLVIRLVLLSVLLAIGISWVI